MKGFIEVTDYETDSTLLINVNYIIALDEASCRANPTCLITINTDNELYKELETNESYKEIKKLIEEAQG